MDRFSRITRLIGSDKQQSLKRSHVAVFGVGAVGSYAVEALARSGIGQFTLIDFDTVNRTNINRQLIALESTVGSYKVEAARNRILDINPDAQVNMYPVIVTKENIHSILASRPDCVVDAIDSLYAKADILEFSWNNSLPAVSSMGAALRTDPSMIHTADLHETRNCPMARKLRMEMRKRQVGRGIHAVYSMEEVRYDYSTAGTPPAATGQLHPDGLKAGPRHVLGSLPTLTGIFGLTVANRCLQLLSGGFFTEE